MGIPQFYKWLSSRYPQCVRNAKEDRPLIINGVRCPVNITRPNPNGFEFDNLYVDVNGIIHPCFDPEDMPAPTTYEEVFEAVFKYIDKIFSIIRPRKLLFLAVDGVAPRAKMNQQRSRRFRTAKEAVDEALRAEGNAGEISSLPQQSKKMDPNVITPGTEFMDLLSSALHYYIHLRMNEDLGWKGIKVILSDACVPGEGEHKIMSYIRLQRNLPGYDPNTRHCLYGLDSDLIMLALTTHEVHFTILREFRVGSNNGSKQKKAFRRKQEQLRKKVKASGNLEAYILGQKFQFFNIWTLREYLALDLRILNQELTMEADLERLIDDFVFMCLFVGNDFLPGIPSLDISKGAISELLSIYIKGFVERGGYLTDSFKVDLKRVKHFLEAVNHEIIFIKCGKTCGGKTRARKKRHMGKAEIDLKRNYYNQKFGAKSKDDRERIRTDAVFKYTEGVCWIMRYYYEGVCSWQWFYPYHYAPRASDFYDIDKFEFHFSIGKPFKPFDQLMGVLPAASAHALPLFYRKLMTDALSPILDFYPADFQVDINGKRFAWQGICKLPFIEESRLLAEIAKVEHTLTDEERRRNSFGRDVLFVHISHPLGEGINSFCKKVNGDTKLLEGEVIGKIDPKFSDGMNGFICLSDKSVWPVEIHSPIEGMKMIAKNGVLSVFYHNPPFHSHIPRPLPGVILFEEGLRNMRGGSEKRKLIGGAFVANKIGAPREQNKGDGNQIRAHGLQETKIELSVDLLQEIRAKVKPNWLHPRIIADVSTNGLQGTKTEVNVDGGEEIRTEVNSNVVQHVKTEVMSRKQNRKGKKQNLGEAGDDPHEGVEKFDGSGPSEQNKGDGNKAGATGLQGTITEVNANVFEGTKAEVNADGLQGIRTEVNANGVQGIKAEVNVDGLQGLRTEVTASGVQDVKTEVISRKRKWKAKKKKLAEGGDGPDKGVEKFESIAPSEQNKGDGNQAGSTGLQGTITEGCTNVFQGTKPEVNTDGLQGKKTEANKDGLQGIRTEVNASGVQDVKTEVLSRWKRKSKKKKLGEGGDALQKVDDVHMGVEKFDSNASSNQNKVEGNQDDADRLQETITEVNANVLQGIKPEVNADRLLGIRAEVNANGLQDVKSEVVSRKRKRKSKKMKSGERGVAKFEGSCPSEQNERNGNQGGGADGSQGTITEGNANGFLGTKPEVNANGSAGVEIEVEGIKTEAKSSKRKPRAKKRKQNKIDSALTNIFDKLES